MKKFARDILRRRFPQSGSTGRAVEVILSAFCVVVSRKNSLLSGAARTARFPSFSRSLSWKDKCTTAAAPGATRKLQWISEPGVAAPDHFSCSQKPGALKIEGDSERDYAR